MSDFEDLQDRLAGCDDGLSADIPMWALLLLDREEEFVNLRQMCRHGSETFWPAQNEHSAASSSSVPAVRSVPSSDVAGNQEESRRSGRPLGPFRFLTLKTRPSKYGLCTSCGTPRKLHLIKTGRHAGEIWLRCSNFWLRNRDSKPLCWHGKKFLGQPPPSLIRQQKEMKKTLKFQLQHGPQTRA